MIIDAANRASAQANPSAKPVVTTQGTGGKVEKATLAPVGGSLSPQALPAEAQLEPPGGNVDADIKSAVDELSAHVQSWQRDLNFSVDDELGRVIITVMDSRTQEVIRQIPAEEVLAMARFLADMSDESGKIEGLLIRAEV